MSSSDRPRVPEKRTSLADMARASQRAVRTGQSVAPPPVSSSGVPQRSSIRPVAPEHTNPTNGDSGLINMQQLRASAAPPPPSQVGSSHGFAAGVPSGQSGMMAAPRPAFAPRIPVAPPLPEIEPVRHKRSSGAFWGGTIALVGIAAAGVLVMNSRGMLDGYKAKYLGATAAQVPAQPQAPATPPPAAPENAAAAPAQAPAPVLAAAPANPAAQNAPSGNANSAAAAAPAPKADDQAPATPGPKGKTRAVAAAAPAPAPKAAAAAPAPKGGAGASKSELAAAMAAPAAAPEPPAAAPAPAPAPAAPAAPAEGGLKGAMAKAAGPPMAGGEAVTAAAGPQSNGSNVPEVPSQGAIQGAIGAHMSAAKGCVRGDAPPSRVSLTFGSDGKVKSVSISGNAAGSPAEGCLKSAFSKSSVGPFSRASYPVSFTVRP